MLDLTMLYKTLVGGFIVAWIGVTVTLLPWSEREILALRRTGIALGAVLADKARAAWRKERP